MSWQSSACFICSNKVLSSHKSYRLFFNILESGTVYEIWFSAMSSSDKNLSWIFPILWSKFWHNFIVTGIWVGVGTDDDAIKFHMALVDEDLEDFSVDAGLLKQSGKLSPYIFLERREAGNMPLPQAMSFLMRSASCAENGQLHPFMTWRSRVGENSEFGV